MNFGSCPKDEARLRATGNGQLAKREIKEMWVFDLPLDSDDLDGGGELLESSNILLD